MERRFEEYCANVNEVNSLVKPAVKSSMSSEDIVRMILAGSERIHELKLKNDAFLLDAIYSKKADELTEDEANRLFEFAQELFTKGSLDTGVSYKIHCVLYDYAILKNDRDMEIRELYYMGLTLNSLHMQNITNNINTNGQRIHDCFSKGAAYMKDYESISNENTRAYIIRCLGNRKYGYPLIKGSGEWNKPPVATKGYKYYCKFFDEAMGIIESDYYRKLNPGIEWDTYEYLMHYDRTTYLSNLRMELDDNEKTPEYKKMAEDVLESAEFVYRRQNEAATKNFQQLAHRTIYVHCAALFHAGKMTANDLIENLFECLKSADVQDYSKTGMSDNIGFPTYIHHYSEYLNPEDKSRLDSRIDAAYEHSKEYIRRCPDTSIGDKLGGWITELINGQIVRDKAFRSSAMQYLLYCHPPTYVHSYVVAFLSKTIFLEMLNSVPEKLIGVFGSESKEQLLDGRDAYAKRAFYCGLYHDIGKYMVLPYISVYSRKLLDEEFEAITYHTVQGYYMLSNYPDLDIEAQVALRHHRRYDNKAGYPNYCDEPAPDNSKAIVDIVTVADSLDAATDNIGRSYSVAKTVDRLVEELRNGSGTRYSPDVVEVFNNEEFMERLKRELDEYRKSTYCAAYTLIKRDFADNQ